MATILLAFVKLLASRMNSHSRAKALEEADLEGLLLVALKPPGDNVSWQLKTSNS
jgi:hypothetical protein